VEVLVTAFFFTAPFIAAQSYVIEEALYLHFAISHYRPGF